MQTPRRPFTFLLIVAGLCLPLTHAAAQPNASSSESATEDLQIFHHTDLYFGEHIPIQEIPVHVDPQGDNAGLKKAGKFQVTGPPNQKVMITVENETDLINETNESIPLTLDARGSKMDHQQSADESVNNAQQVLLDPNEGAYWIWIGGDIVIEEDQPGGHYETTILVEVEEHLQ